MFAHDSSLIQLPLLTAEGEFTASYSNEGLAELRFPRGQTATPDKRDDRIAAKILRWHHQTFASVKAVLMGESPQALPPLDLSRGTAFQRNVWAALRRIKLGQTQSYGMIAKSIGNPKAVRAVGGACGANPIPLLIPCHRVLAANGKIGGFSGGLDWKRKLLACEQVHPA